MTEGNTLCPFKLWLVYSIQCAYTSYTCSGSPGMNTCSVKIDTLVLMSKLKSGCTLNIFLPFQDFKCSKIKTHLSMIHELSKTLYFISVL